MNRSRRGPSGSSVVRPPRRSRVDLVLGVAAVLAVSLAVVSLISLARSRPDVQEYKPGQLLADLPEIQLRVDRPTLLIFFSPFCKPCIDSMDFYRRLMAEPHAARIVLVGREGLNELTECVSEYRLQPDQIVSIGRRPIRIRGTPTLVLVGRNGIVGRVWDGAPREHGWGEEVASNIR